MNSHKYYPTFESVFYDQPAQTLNSFPQHILNGLLSYGWLPDEPWVISAKVSVPSVLIREYAIPT